MQYKAGSFKTEDLELGDQIISNDGKILTGEESIVLNRGFAHIQKSSLENNFTIKIEKNFLGQKSEITLSREELKAIFNLIF